ncbi:adenylylsulfate kinase [Mucilaginibacter yixingensis]|uniref:Adenylyl-sulfate kinase n=1 Tax=Mucilaginibacter yixingensis TaxID=1295612 RepID=A0A2T5JFN5_9SPHI|nr:adenylyl-sulfate kinase [Mucilaginibacter yixingensis]PTR01229.1 adenylylsulfate kinase [Mucilaginibacter yixingensis]
MTPDIITAQYDGRALEAIEQRNGHKAAVVWLTGLSGAGKTTIADEVKLRLFEQGVHSFALDGDQLRSGLNKDLGFTAADRHENIRRAAAVAGLFYQSGAVVLCSFISPFATDREEVKKQFPEGRFLEIYVKCSLEECARRDPKQLYKKALNQSIPNFTGINSPYEVPEKPNMVINTEHCTETEAAEMVLTLLQVEGIITY